MESLAAHHASDIIQLLIWLFLTIGGAFVAVLVWIGMRVANKLDGIEKAIGMTNDTLNTIERDLRKEIIKHDHRLIILEQRDHHQAYL
jgi:hypothetical protein